MRFQLHIYRPNFQLVLCGKQTKYRHEHIWNSFHRAGEEKVFIHFEIAHIVNIVRGRPLHEFTVVEMCCARIGRCFAKICQS